MDIRKPLYVHIVTTLTAASIAALPQSDLARALRVALVVGAGNAVASRVAWSSARKEKVQILQKEEELSRLREELQQRSGQLQELGARLAERHQLLQQLQDRDQRVQSLQAEIEELQNQLFQREEEIEELRAEQQRKDEEIKELKDRIKGFQDTVYTTSKGTGHYRSCNPSETDIILKTNETEFYPQEAKSFILEILHRAIDQAYEESRVRHILEDLIQHNDAQESNRHRQDTAC